MELVRLQTEPFDVANLIRFMGGNTVGATITFIGTVKGLTETGPVDRIDFTADEPVALRQMDLLRQEARDRFQLHEAALIHRLGPLEVGEPIVVTAASAPHREDAFQACRWLIDNLKERVPIWKREITPKGDRWVQPGPMEAGSGGE